MIDFRMPLRSFPQMGLKKFETLTALTSQIINFLEQADIKRYQDKTKLRNLFLNL